MTFGSPTTSKAKFTPPEVIALISSTVSVFVGFIVCVAPNSIALVNLESTGSIAIILLAPAMLHPCIVLSPTPPHPKTAVVSPILTLELFINAPIQ